jgi:mono/diheme cytochrome c family protein
MGFKRFVTILEVAVGIAALAFVLALFVNEPDDGGTGGGGTASAPPGAAVYAASCAGCHGADGGGGLGPQLAGRVVDKFPDAADQVAVVTNGRGGMPSFNGDLTPQQIEQVVEYTRTGLG